MTRHEEGPPRSSPPAVSFSDRDDASFHGIKSKLAKQSLAHHATKTPSVHASVTQKKQAPDVNVKTASEVKEVRRKTHQEHICDEFERALASTSKRRTGRDKKQAQGRDATWNLEQRRAALRPYHLSLPQILALRNATYADHLLPVDISHLGVLWLCDRDHDGKITLDDLLYLVEYCKETMKQSSSSSYPSWQQHEREAMIQSVCTEALWEDVRLDRERFVEWMGALVYEASTQRRRFWRHGSQVYVETAAVESLHRFLRMQDYGLEFQGFVDLLQRAGEGEGLMDLFDEEQDDFVPLGVVKEWVRGVYVGATRLLADVA